MSIDWSPSAKFCSSSAHVGWAAALIAASPNSGIELWLVVSMFVIFAIIKEFWADLSWLEHDTIQGSVLDFTTYCVGIVIGLVSLYHFWMSLVLAISVLITLAVLDYDNQLPERENT